MNGVTAETQRKRIKDIDKLLNHIIDVEEPELSEDEFDLIIKALTMYRAVIQMDLSRRT